MTGQMGVVGDAATVPVMTLATPVCLLITTRSMRLLEAGAAAMVTVCVDWRAPLVTEAPGPIDTFMLVPVTVGWNHAPSQLMAAELLSCDACHAVKVWVVMLLGVNALARVMVRLHSS